MCEHHRRQSRVVCHKTPDVVLTTSKKPPWFYESYWCITYFMFYTSLYYVNILYLHSILSVHTNNVNTFYSLPTRKYSCFPLSNSFFHFCTKYVCKIHISLCEFLNKCICKTKSVTWYVLLINKSRLSFYHWRIRLTDI